MVLKKNISSHNCGGNVMVFRLNIATAIAATTTTFSRNIKDRRYPIAINNSQTQHQ